MIPQWAGNERLNRRKAQREWRTLPCSRFTHGENWEWWGDYREAINFGGWLTGEWELFKLLAAEVECLGDESTDLARSHTTAASFCGGKGQALACSRQCNVSKTSLLAQRLFVCLCWPLWGTGISWHHIIRATKFCSEREARRSTFGREAPFNEVCSKNDGELKALRLVNGEERNGVKVGINIGGRRIVPRLPELLEVAHQEWSAVELQESAAGAHHIEEAPNVANALVRFWRC